MEDALVRFLKRKGAADYGLNPCFNGRCTRTSVEPSIFREYLCLNPCFNGRCTRTSVNLSEAKLLTLVLILVLMEDALVQLR